TLGLAPDRPVASGLLGDPELDGGAEWGGDVAKGHREGVGEGRQHRVEEATRGLARSSDRVANVLLVVPAFGVLPRDVEPDWRRRRTGPAHRTPEGQRIERRE